MNFRVERYDDVSSTNNIIKERIDAGDPEGTVVRAKTQNGGYGRRGNAWSSPEGGLYLSILLRPNVPLEDLPTLPHICAIAARRAIASFLGSEKADHVEIKWPNDIVYTGSANSSASENPKHAPFNKMCGISVEQRGGAVCIGIGINVKKPQFGQSDNTQSGITTSLKSEVSKNVPVYLEELMPTDSNVDLEALEAKLLDEIDSVYSIWKETLFVTFRKEYLDHFALEGFRARIDESSTSAIECEVIGINDRGNLEVIPIGENEIKTLTSGTVRAL